MKKTFLTLVLSCLIAVSIYAQETTSPLKFIKKSDSEITNITMDGEPVEVEYYIFPDKNHVVFYSEKYKNTYKCRFFKRIREGEEGSAGWYESEYHIYFMATSLDEFIWVEKGKEIKPPRYYIVGQRRSVLLMDEKRGISFVVVSGLAPSKFSNLRQPQKMEGLFYVKLDKNFDECLFYNGEFLPKSIVAVTSCTLLKDVVVYNKSDNSTYVCKDTSKLIDFAYARFEQIKQEEDKSKEYIIWRSFTNETFCIIKNGVDVTADFKITNDETVYHNRVATSPDGKIYILENALGYSNKWFTSYPK